MSKRCSVAPTTGEKELLMPDLCFFFIFGNGGLYWQTFRQVSGQYRFLIFLFTHPYKIFLLIVAVRKPVYCCIYSSVNFCTFTEHTPPRPRFSKVVLMLSCPLLVVVHFLRWGRHLSVLGSSAKSNKSVKRQRGQRMEAKSFVYLKFENWHTVS